MTAVTLAAAIATFFAPLVAAPLLARWPWQPVATVSVATSFVAAGVVVVRTPGT